MTDGMMTMFSESSFCVSRSVCLSVCVLARALHCHWHRTVAVRRRRSAVNYRRNRKYRGGHVYDEMRQESAEIIEETLVTSWVIGVREVSAVRGWGESRPAINNITTHDVVTTVTLMHVT